MTTSFWLAERLDVISSLLAAGVRVCGWRGIDTIRRSPIHTQWAAGSGQ